MNQPYCPRCKLSMGCAVTGIMQIGPGSYPSWEGVSKLATYYGIAWRSTWYVNTTIKERALCMGAKYRKRREK